MLFQPTYFSPIPHFQQVLKADEIVFEVHDNYLKQTYRTRFNIYNSNGILTLTIPIINQKGIKQRTRDTLIDNTAKWQQNHFRSIKNSYQSSPFYEFYEDDIVPLYENKQKYLLDFILKTQELSLELLQIDTKVCQTEVFRLDYEKKEDFRFLAKVNQVKLIKQAQYKQVFEAKHGFIPNLSILDLLFNEGPNATTIINY